MDITQLRFEDNRPLFRLVHSLGCGMIVPILILP